MFYVMMKKEKRNGFIQFENVGKAGCFDDAKELVEDLKAMDWHNLQPESRDGFTQDDIYEMEHAEYLILDEPEY